MGGTSARENLTVTHAWCNWTHPKAAPAELIEAKEPMDVRRE
jgi:hypothetical protein